MPDDTRSVDERRAMTSHHQPGDRRPFERGDCCGAMARSAPIRSRSWKQMVSKDVIRRGVCDPRTFVSSPDAGTSYDV
jgi:hypothetical protein